MTYTKLARTRVASGADKPSSLNLRFALAFFALISGGVITQAQSNVQYKGVSTLGQKGITMKVSDIMRLPAYTSLDTLINGARKWNEVESERGELPNDPNAIPSATYPPSSNPIGQEGKYNYSPFSPQTIGTQWTGGQAGNLFPPDSHGAVGPTQVVCTTNSTVKVFDKNGTLGGLNTTLDTFFASVRNGGTSDPRVTFDRLSQKWYICAITVASPYRILLAVSSGPTITNTASFTFFFISRSTTLPDYPSLGVDANGVYIGENSFLNAASFTGCNVSVIQKSSVQGAGPIFSTLFQVATSSGEGPFAPRGVDNDDPAPANGYIVGPSNIAFSRLVVRKVTGANTATPTMGANQLITVNSTANPITPVPSIGQSIDALDDRIFHAQMHLNRKTGLRTLWAAHNIRMNSSGVGTGGGDRDGSRWYELSVSGTPSVVQSGTALDTNATGFDHYTIPSIAMSGQGHAALGFTMTRSGQLIRIGSAGRLVGDASGATQLPGTLAFTSPATYNPGISRWGDYSSTVVDPADDQTMWTFQEFGATASQWGVRCIKLIAPPPSPVSSVSPNSLSPGQTTNITVNGTQTAGSEYYDTDAGYPKRLACTFNSDITVNSITFSHANPQQIVLNVTVAGGAGAGPRNLTIVNPDGQSVVANAAVTITGGATTETLAPGSEAISLGTTTSGGNLASWAADDANARTICKFFVPNVNSPFIRVNLNFTTTKASPTAITFRVKIGTKTGGTQNMTLYVQNKTNSTFVPTNVAGVSIAAGTTYNGNAAGTLSDYVGGGGAMTGQIEVTAVGFQAVAFPCVGFELGNMVVTG